MTWRSTSATSAPSGVLPGRRMIATGLPVRRLVDVDRLKAAAVVIGVEQRQLLAAVNPVLGVVDVEQDAPRHLLEAVAEHLDHRRHHALERGRAGQVFQPADGRLRAQIGAALGQPPDRHLEGRIGRAARRSRCRRDSPPRSAGRGSGSSRRACAAPVPARAGPRCNRPAARRSPAAARSPPAAISRRPRSSGRHRKRQVHRLTRDRWQTRQNPRTFVHGGRELRWPSVDPASATKSYTNPTAYVAPASPFTPPDELSGLGGNCRPVTKCRRYSGQTLPRCARYLPLGHGARLISSGITVSSPYSASYSA